MTASWASRCSASSRASRSASRTSPSQPQRAGDRLLGDRPVGQQRGHVDGVVARVHAGAGLVDRVPVGGEALGGQLGLGLARLDALAVGQHHRPHRGGDQQRGGDLEGQQVPGEDQPRRCPGRCRRARRWPRPGPTTVVPRQRVGDRRRAAGPRKPTNASTGQHALALERLDEGVGGVHAHDHEHEDEQHHHRAGVDDDLHHPQEHGVLGDVEDRQVDHRQRDEQGAVHGLAGQDHARRRRSPPGWRRPRR